MDNRQLPDSQLWLLRAERGNEFAGPLLELGIVSMGMGIGPIEQDDTIGVIINRVTKEFP